MTGIDPIGSVIYRVGAVSPSLRARLLWIRERRQGDLTMRLVDTLVAPGDVALDIGANLGLFAYRMSQLTGPSGRVHVFEPDPDQLPSLRRLARARPNVTLHPVAASATTGAVELRVPLIDGEAFHTRASLEDHEGEHQAVRVESARLDDVLGEDLGRVSFVKCDVEGHEFAVLQGGREMLQAAHPILLVEIEQRHQRRDIADTFAYLADLGYDGFAVHSSGLAPLETFELQRDQQSQVPTDSIPSKPPAAYINNFLFVAAGRRPPGVDRLLSR